MKKPATASCYPEIRIKAGFHLREQVSVRLHELAADNKPLLSLQEVEDIADRYRSAWQPYEPTLAQGMCDLLGLSFRKNVIDVYIAQYIGAFSDPLIISTGSQPDVFIDILAHELLHCLQTDNTTIPPTTRLVPEWRKLYGDGFDRPTLVHIPVHAIHKALYLDVLHEPARLERDIERAGRFQAQPYIDAWRYVNEHDYRTLVNQLQELYASLRA